jgi:hypothetical protein
VSGTRKLLLSGMALTLLLALVAVASRAHRPGGHAGSAPANPPTLIADYLSTLALVLLPLGAVFLVWVLAQRRLVMLQTGRANWRRTLVSVVAFGLVLAAAVYAANLHRRSDRQQLATPSVASPLQGAKGKSTSASSVYRARFRWLPVLVLASVGLVLAGAAGVAVVRRRRNLGAWEEEARLAVALDEVLADTLDDLRAESDPRRAVIRAYARMERTFAAYGLPREEAETPLEYLARALESLRVSAFSVRRLTQLFERAKFSPHAIDSSMKDDAIEALVGLRAELEHGHEVAA